MLFQQHAKVFLVHHLGYLGGLSLLVVAIRPVPRDLHVLVIHFRLNPLVLDHHPALVLILVDRVDDEGDHEGDRIEEEGDPEGALDAAPGVVGQRGQMPGGQTT